MLYEVVFFDSKKWRSVVFENTKQAVNWIKLAKKIIVIKHPHIRKKDDDEIYLNALKPENHPISWEEETY